MMHDLRRKRNRIDLFYQELSAFGVDSKRLLKRYGEGKPLLNLGRCVAGILK